MMIGIAHPLSWCDCERVAGVKRGAGAETALYTIHYTPYTIHYTLYFTLFTIYYIYTIHNPECALFTIHYTIHYSQYTIYTLYTIQTVL